MVNGCGSELSNAARSRCSPASHDVTHPSNAMPQPALEEIFEV